MPEPPRLPYPEFQHFQQELRDRYAILGKAGEGAMGIVFDARDLRHDRHVAIKLLRPELAASVGTERFLREIRIEAGLNHPHILPVYDSGEAAGLLYSVTPFVEGETLAERLRRERQLTCAEALRICREIADALAFAHTHQVIHRDVKPGNILLQSGHAFLADFGLAKATSLAGQDSLTRTGFSVGTPAYSSPEQAAGDPNPDGRADLYSLGCVLYEMLAGQPPFQGPSSDSVMRQHMTADPMPIRILRPAIPEAVQVILERLLAKTPADRFSSAPELVRALDAATSGEFPQARRAPFRLQRRWLRPIVSATAVSLLIIGGVWAVGGMATRSPTEPFLLDPKDVAVLYLADLSPDGSLGHVADGLTEGLIANLTRVRGLTVISRNGVVPFRDGSPPLDSIAQLLEVGTLIRGSVEPSAGGIRISVHLVEGLSGADFDRSTFEIAGTDYLVAQDSLVQEVAWLLRDRLGEEVRLRSRQRSTTSVAAWALAQRGERERRSAEALFAKGELDGGLDGMARADSFFKLAESADLSWAVPPTNRGWIEYRSSRVAPDLQDRLVTIERGLAHAERALDMDPTHPPALELRGTLRYWHWLLGVTPDAVEASALLAGAQADLEAAVDLDPGLASAHSTLSHLYYQVNDLTSALLSARAAYEADAFLDSASEVLWRLFLASYDTERFTQARSTCDEGRRRFADDYRFSECKLLELTLPGVARDVDEAWRLRERTVALTIEANRAYEEHKTAIYVAAVLALAEEVDSARSVLLRARTGADVDPYHELPFFEAWVRTELGDYDEAVERLTTLFAGFDGGGGGDGADWASHWWWNDLRAHPGFQRLVQATR